MKRCPACGETLPRLAFHMNRAQADGLQPHCKACRSANRKPDAPRGYDVDRRLNLQAKYSITPERFDELLAEQGGRCAICGSFAGGGRWGTFHVDHDHSCCPGKRSCGKCIRGLLCASCNVGLGSFRDSPDRLRSAIAYLGAGS